MTIPPDAPTRAPDAKARKFVRQRRLVAAFGVVLILAGILILFVLPRVPAPMRMMAGLGDLFMGLVLLVLVRQNRAF